MIPICMLIILATRSTVALLNTLFRLADIALSCFGSHVLEKMCLSIQSHHKTQRKEMDRVIITLATVKFVFISLG